MPPELHTHYLAPTRWICWPDPDRVCLEGGCIHCTPDPTSDRAYVRAHHRAMTQDQVEAYADTNAIVVDQRWIDFGMTVRSTTPEVSQVC